MAQPENQVPEARVRGQEWVRGFLFSVKIDSSLARLRVLTKFLAIPILSLVILRFIKTNDPDPLVAGLMVLAALVGLSLGGTPMGIQILGGPWMAWLRPHLRLPGSLTAVLGR